MKTVDVKLTISRATATGAENRGDVVAVGCLEAGRMLRAGQIEKPDAKTLKAIAAAEAAANKETAAAPAPEPEPAPDPAPEPAPEPETGGAA